jgi:hypothetical protein
VRLVVVFSHIDIDISPQTLSFSHFSKPALMNSEANESCTETETAGYSETLTHYMETLVRSLIFTPQRESQISHFHFINQHLQTIFSRLDGLLNIARFIPEVTKHSCDQCPGQDEHNL